MKAMELSSSQTKLPDWIIISAIERLYLGSKGIYDHQLLSILESLCDPVKGSIRLSALAFFRDITTVQECYDEYHMMPILDSIGDLITRGQEDVLRQAFELEYYPKDVSNKFSYLYSHTLQFLCDCTQGLYRRQALAYFIHWKDYERIPTTCVDTLADLILWGQHDAFLEMSNLPLFKQEGPYMDPWFVRYFCDKSWQV